MSAQTTKSCSRALANKENVANIANFNLLDDNAQYWILSKQPFSESEFIQSVADSSEPNQQLQISNKPGPYVKQAPRKVTDVCGAVRAVVC